MNTKININNLFPQFNKNIPGCAVSVLKNEKIILELCIGQANLDTKTLIRPDTAFRLASLTKPFTAMAIMILKERGKLKFDDYLTKFFPEFPSYGKNITIRQLLTHTSGMPDHEKPLYKTIKKGEESTIYDALGVLKKQQKTLFEPGSRYQYSDAGFVMLALIIERVTGQRYAEFLSENIFTPLKMDNTVVLDERKAIVRNRAYGYRKVKSKYELFDYDPLNYIVGDEGIYSATQDLIKWWGAWTTNALVDKKTLKEALIPQRLTNATFGRCGFSWFITKINNRKVIFHDGFWVGFNNIMLTDYNSRITVIMLSNTTEFPTEELKIEAVKKILRYTTGEVMI